MKASMVFDVAQFIKTIDRPAESIMLDEELVVAFRAREVAVSPRIGHIHAWGVSMAVEEIQHDHPKMPSELILRHSSGSHAQILHFREDVMHGGFHLRVFAPPVNIQRP